MMPLLAAIVAAIPLSPSFAKSAPDCASGDGSDFIYADGFEMPLPFPYTAFAADVSNDRFIAFDLKDPSVTTPVGGGNGSAFLMDFVGDDFSKAYGIDAYGAMINTFATIDTATGAISKIGVSNPSMDPGGWTGFKYDRSTGVAYAVGTGCGSSSHLYTIDLGTGASTLVTEIAGLPCVSGIAISPDGAMFGLDIAADVLYSIDKTSGATSPIGPIGFDAGPYKDLDFDDSNGVLYYAGNNTGIGPQLRTIIPNALIGPLDSGLLAGFAIATRSHEACRPAHNTAQDTTQPVKRSESP
jgi:hypothetical protein